MTVDNDLTDSARQQLRSVRNVLLRVHKTLLEFEREGYERDHGKITNSYEYLNLVMNDPWFAWLRQLSELVVEMDELLAAKEGAAETTAVALMEQAKMLLTPAESGSEFQRKYFAAMQLSPEVVVAHSEFASVQGPARLSKEVH